MGIASEIERLTDLHRSGALSDEEFARAKAAILSAPPDVSGALPPPERPDPARTQGDGREREERQYAMFVHFSLLAGLVVPLAGFVLPVVLWQTKKREMPSIDAHGKAVVNWMISSLIYSVACFVLVFVIVGIPLLIALGILSVVFPILGGLKANDGVLWRYPLSITFLK
jgi:uncharacterized Tic20 family protein